MTKAAYVGTVPLNFLDNSQTYWLTKANDDIIKTGFVNKPNGYFFTLGSGVASWMTSLATIPAYSLPTNSQFYLAGRTVFRWGGSRDPFEIDLDQYGFTPDYNKGAVIVWKAPKTEPHHLSHLPEVLAQMPKEYKELCVAVLNKELV